MFTFIFALVLCGEPVSKADFCMISLNRPLIQSKAQAELKEEKEVFLDYKNGYEIAKLLKKKLYVGTNLSEGMHKLASATAKTDGAIYCICNDGLFENGVTKLFYDPEKGDLYIQPKPVEVKEDLESFDDCFEGGCSNGSCSMGNSNSCSSGSCSPSSMDLRSVKGSGKSRIKSKRGGGSCASCQ